MSVEVLVVCSTNTSLSPLLRAMVEQELKRLGIEHRVQCHSAGTHCGKDSRGSCSRTRRYAKLHGLDISAHTTCPLGAVDLQRYDVILVMNEEIYWNVKGLLGGAFQGELKLASAYTKQSAIREIPDPLFQDISFEELFPILELTCKGLLERIEIILKQKEFESRP